MIDLEYFKNPTAEVAKSLIGKILKVNHEDYSLSGIIVETEAYLFENDPACHASFGKTKRNKDMFLEGGHVYVYLIYGIHHCFNIVTEKEGRGCAVLIRALEPVEGIEIMKKNRNTNSLKNLCSGPGKICEALEIDKKYSGEFLGENIQVLDNYYTDLNVISTKRIGISKAKDLNLRFYKADSEYISRK